MTKSPCTDCERRRIGCHTICPEYAAWKRERDAANDARAREQERWPELPRNVLRRIWREMRRK